MVTYPEYPREKRIYPEPVVDIAYSYAATVDNALDAVVGMRPVGHAMEIADNLAPANVIRRTTGIPKPSEIVEDVLDKIDEALRGPLARRLLRGRRW